MRHSVRSLRNYFRVLRQSTSVLVEGVMEITKTSRRANMPQPRTSEICMRMLVLGYLGKLLGSNIL
jgi:hypothetical protein